MANIFDIVYQKAQGLKFANISATDDQQSRDNTLFADLRYPLTMPETYCQKYEKSDYIRIQYRTDYTQYTVSIVPENGTKFTVTSNQVLIYTDPTTGLNYYDLELVLGFLDVGVYCILIELYQADSPINSFQSEPFYLKDKWDDTLWLECYGNLRSYDDNMYWVERQGIRVRAMDKRVEFSQSKNVDENINNTPRTLKAKPNRAIIVEFDIEPEWIYEKVNIFLNHDEFYVNGIKYNNDEAVSMDPLGKMIQYKSAITLIESEYQNGESKILTGDIPPPPEPGEARLLAINDTQALGISNTKALGI